MDRGGSAAESGLNIEAREVLDEHNPSDLEKKHIPSIDAPDAVEAGEAFAVTVEVGEGMHHPSQPGHFIQYISLYADGDLLARLDLTAYRTRPKATFWVSLNEPVEELRACQHCNLHGTWVGRKVIDVLE
jgi:superoxide reductase